MDNLRDENNTESGNRHSPSSDFLTWVMAFRHDMVIYHNHKENLAYLATAAYVAGATALISNTKVTTDFRIIAVWTLAGGLGFVFVVWQLYNRWIAAKMVDIFTILSAECLENPVIPPEKRKSICLLQGRFPIAFRDKVKRELRIHFDCPLPPLTRRIAEWLKAPDIIHDRIHVFGMVLYGILVLLILLSKALPHSL